MEYFSNSRRSRSIHLSSGRTFSTINENIYTTINFNPNDNSITMEINEDLNHQIFIVNNDDKTDGILYLPIGITNYDYQLSIINTTSNDLIIYTIDPTNYPIYVNSFSADTNSVTDYDSFILPSKRLVKLTHILVDGATDGFGYYET